VKLFTQHVEDTEKLKPAIRGKKGIEYGNQELRNGLGGGGRKREGLSAGGVGVITAGLI
jgi:hypothetical protein